MKWPRVQVRRLARLGTGHTPSRQRPEYWENCTIPWLTLADVWQLRDGTKQVITDTAERISELGLANSAAVLHPAGTVALSRTASVGFSCILGQDMATSQDFATWTCGPELLPTFLLWALRGTIDEIRATTMGSTHKTIYMPDIEQIRVSWPPLEAQERIVEYLDSETARIDGLIEKKQLSIRLLFEWEQASLLKELGDWREEDPVTLRQYGTRVVTGPFGTQLQAAEYVRNGIPVINPTHLRRGRIAPDHDVTVPEEVAQRLARHRLRRGDVVMGRKGDVGRCAVTPEGAEGWLCGSDSIAIRTDTTKLLPEWLSLLLRVDLYRQQLAASATGAMVTGINESVLLAMALPARSVASQAAAVTRGRRIAEHIEEVVSRLERQIELLREHRQALITAAVTRLDVVESPAA